MIQHLTHVFSSLEALQTEICTGAVARTAADSRSLLIQIYCAEADQGHIAAITSLIANALPTAVVVGATTVGEVAHGQLMTSQTVIGFTFFASSNLNVVAMACDSGDERVTGAELACRASECAPEIAGVLLLATPLSIDAAELLKGIESNLGDYPLFGGGAGDYAAMKNSLVFSGTELFDKGAIAVIFSGKDLHIEAKTYLGWRPLSRSMQVTKTDGLHVLSIDDQPAFEVYRRYLNIPNDDQFFLNALEFPFLLERNGEMLARVPVATNEDGALKFVADIREGETFRIGYGDMDLIIEDSRDIHHSMSQFSPQVVFLYTCGCRRFLMQEDVELETLPFEALAPTFGFYTYGEFFRSSNLSLLNSTMVAVSLREGVQSLQELSDPGKANDTAPVPRDPYANKHTRVVSRLLRFIDAVTSELEESHQEVTKLSVTDGLTQLFNRIYLDRVLNEQIDLATRYGTPFSVILLDVDHFKQVNDTYGHLAGDEVLVRLANALTAHTRSVDIVGRWGGEEFMIITPGIGPDEAAQLAEKLRSVTASLNIPVVGHKTASFGVTGYTSGDDLSKVIARADAALYTAKKAGRNRVEKGRLH